MSNRLFDSTTWFLRCCSNLTGCASQPDQRHIEARTADHRICETHCASSDDSKVSQPNPTSTSYPCHADTVSSNSANLAAANAHLFKLLPLTHTSDPDLSHQISLLEITLLMHPSGPDLPSAYRRITSLLATTSDLAQTLHLLTLKAGVFAAAGKPEKGFSIAVRAASRAERAGLGPVLLEALAALAEILNKVGEFGPAREVVEAALPQVCLLLLPLLLIYLVSGLCCGLFANELVHLGFRERSI
jgi:hypothetical protein